jgi:hypothetical protein
VSAKWRTDTDSSSTVIRACAILATAVQCAVLVGLAAFVVLVTRVFQEITASGSSDPRVMAEGIGQAMIPVVLAIGISVWGILGSVLIVVASNYRARWFYWASVALAIVHILTIPFGTVFGLVFLVLLVVKRDKFRSERAAERAATSAGSG